MGGAGPLIRERRPHGRRHAEHVDAGRAAELPELEQAGLGVARGAADLHLHQHRALRAVVDGAGLRGLVRELLLERSHQLEEVGVVPAVERVGRDGVELAPLPPAPPKERPKETGPARAEPKATKPTDSKPVETARAKGGRLLLQAAALGSEPAAQDLSERLRKAGFAPFIEKIETPDGARYRVRVGPFSTRDEAQRAQARLRALGVSATLIST